MRLPRKKEENFVQTDQGTVKERVRTNSLLPMTLQLTFCYRLSDDSITGLYDRLLQIEERCSQLGTSPLVRGPQSNFPTMSIDGSGSHYDSSSRTSALMPDLTISPTAVKINGIDTFGLLEPAFPQPHIKSSLDANARVQDAYRQVQDLKRQSLGKQDALAPKNCDIQPELALVYVQSKSILQRALNVTLN